MDEPNVHTHFTCSRIKCFYPGANLFHNICTVTLESEKADTLQQQYCFVFMNDTSVFSDCPQRVPMVTLCNISFSDHIVINTIRLLNSNSCPSPDGIPLKLSNSLYPYLVEPLERMFNLQLSTTMVSQFWGS